MPAHRIWPGTPAERQDRTRVIELVQRVGRRRLRFSVYDLQRALQEETQLQLVKPAALARHVHDLSRDLLRPAERRLATADTDLETGEVLAPPRGARHTWVLAERWAEYKRAPPDLDDLEKTLHALWVAYVASDREPVPTRAVTDVLRTVEALAPDREQQTYIRLQTLAERADRLAERIPGASERWVRWRPAGLEPVHPEFSAWVSIVREKHSQGGAAGAGHATLNEAVRELVVIALRASRTPDWPSGRPVLIEDIRAQAESSARAMALMRRIERSGRALHEVLNDATRPRIAGGPRARDRMLRFLRRIGERCYYDVPDEPGADHRQLYFLQEDLRTCTSSSHLEGIGREWTAAQRLAKSEDSAVRAIAAVRGLSCWEEAREIESVLEQLGRQRNRLSQRVREWVDARAADYQVVIGRWSTREATEENAAAALALFGLRPAELLAAPRPLLTPSQLRDFVPAIHHGKGSASVFLARLPALRRFLNPVHTDKQDPDPIRAAFTCADRAEGMIYLAEQSGARTLAFLRAGSRFLGRSLRCPLLFRQLARSEVAEHRFAGLAALALLGDLEGAEIALEWLRDPALPAMEAECAFYALLVLRRVEPDEWPAHVRSTKNPAMQRAWREVVLAARQGRWLFQR
jgi:hypothetical protein